VCRMFANPVSPILPSPMCSWRSTPEPNSPLLSFTGYAERFVEGSNYSSESGSFSCSKVTTQVSD